ncbi:patatin-like phospholipase family protein [Motilimonas eburnea]|uniref:patatin-like phospholipase family protein n=1 Tax=Motilimonas eburnea TaxID=1737488 RepID=UPI001E3C8C7E|nr:patatin-like phospholipase family protein [Motilimonas eburnea]MCE2570749.1 patatin-like phospholipase family protein [Motilimonas eburnea]
MLRILWVITLLLVASYSVASERVVNERPKIGLALGGGGAKGAAHIGVLKVLEELNIPVDYIAGTSMGAYVAGMYASGLSADEIEQRMLGTDWSRGFSDKVSRDSLSYRKKKQTEQFMLQSDIGFDGKKIALPHGVIQGETMARLLRESTLNLPYFTSFDSLPIPFRAVAVDLASMQPYVLDSGNLANAMQASMSVPGVLRPMEIDGRLLADGGIVNNLPVDVLKEMGADIVIAVDIASPLSSKEQLDSYLMVLDQLTNFMTQSSTQQQIALMTEQDILIQPAINAFGTGDFERMAQILPLGVVAAQLQRHELASLSVSEQDYQRYHASKMTVRAGIPVGDEFVVDRVEVATDARLAEETILARLKVVEGEPYTEQQLEKNIEALYAEGVFERVDYGFDMREGERVLNVYAKEKPWGPGFFDFMAGMEETSGDSTDIYFGLSYTQTDLSRYGAEWRNRLILGTKTLLSTELYFPLDVEQKFYWDGEIYYLADQRNYFFPDEAGSEELRYWRADYSTLGLATSLGINLASHAILELGGLVETGELELVGSSFDSRFHFYSPYLYLGVDSLDHPFFPTKGTRFTSKLQWIEGENDSLKDHGWRGELQWQNVHSWQRHVVELNAQYAGTELETRIPTLLPELGGYQNLSGFLHHELSGPHKVFAAVVYRYRLFDNDFGAIKLPVYLSGSFEQGNIWQNSRDIRVDNMLTAASLGISVDTRLGPITLASGWAEGGNNAVYFFLGSRL